MILAAILAASALFHFVRIGTPTRPVFDAAYFATYAADNAAHVPYFDIHPPLGKFIYSIPLFFYGKSDLKNATYIENSRTSGGSFITKETNVPYDNFPYVIERVISACFGLLLIFSIFLFVRELAGDGAALLAAFLAAFENALLLDTRLVLMDGMYLAFGFLSLYFFFKNRAGHINSTNQSYKSNWSNRSIFLSALFFGLAMSVKLTAIVFVGPILASMFLKNAMRGEKIPWKTLLRFFGIALLVFLILLIGITNTLFTPQEQLSIIGSLFNIPNALHNPSLFKAVFYQLFVGISGYVSGGSNPMMSPWYAWPFMMKPMHFFYGSTNGYLRAGAQITLLGNPFVWLLSTFAVLFVLWKSVLIIFRRLSPAGERDMAVAMLFGGYIISLIPFFTLIHRATYLYHYFPSLLFAVALAAVLVVRALEGKTQHARALILGAIGILTVWCFILVAPYTYGL